MLVVLCREFPVAGKQIHDANIAATMLAHGERRLLTFNTRDFRRFGEGIEAFSNTKMSLNAGRRDEVNRVGVRGVECRTRGCIEEG